MYAGYRYDKETGLYYLKARYYDTKTGRFLTVDPHAGDEKIPLAQNNYSYTENNPVMKTDPDGERAIRYGYVFRYGRYMRYIRFARYIPYVGWIVIISYVGYWGYRIYKSKSRHERRDSGLAHLPTSEIGKTL